MLTVNFFSNFNAEIDDLHLLRHQRMLLLIFHTSYILCMSNNMSRIVSVLNHDMSHRQIDCIEQDSIPFEALIYAPQSQSEPPQLADFFRASGNASVKVGTVFYLLQT
jgi:hypothetical protein